MQPAAATSPPLAPHHAPHHAAHRARPLITVTITAGACAAFPHGTEMTLRAPSTIDALLSVYESLAPRWVTARPALPFAVQP